jgi:CheY-like chemotaxis protein
LTRKRILIVEDNEDNRRILVYRLRKVGDFEILEASNGMEALEILKSGRPDLIFMDMKMPVMDGWETTRRIRSMEGEPASVPIVAVTAQAMAGDEERALASGCDDYLSKPLVDSQLVREKIERFLGPVGGPAGRPGKEVER